MENTIENKSKFFALYWGQRLWDFEFENSDFVSRDNKVMNIDYYLERKDIPSCYLQLTPLSQISDEDAIEFLNIATYLKGRYKVGDLKLEEVHDLNSNKRWKKLTTLDHNFKEDKGQFFCNFSNHSFSYMNVNDETVLELFDFLRSKGYALPWMGLSVEKMIEYGWIKLTPTND